MILRVQRAWLRIREPRVLRVLFWIGYAIATAGGILTFIRPAVAIEEAWGPILGFSWSAFWLLGGIAGMATCLTGWWQVERIAVGLIECGLAIYAVVLIVMAVVRGNSLSGLITVAFASLLFVIRLVLIRGHDFEPRR